MGIVLAYLAGFFTGPLLLWLLPPLPALIFFMCARKSRYWG